MLRIESSKNPRVLAALRRLERGELFAIEGVRMLRDALAAGLALEALFVAEEAADAALLDRAVAAGAEAYAVPNRVLRRLSDLPSTRGLVALARPPARELATLPLPPDGVGVLLDGVQDPTNVGAILRSAEAFGAACAILVQGSASPFSGRALRASAGSALRLPLAAGATVDAALAWARASRARLVGADARGGVEPRALSRSRPALLAVGSEGHGFSPALAAALDERVTVPVAPAVESLNAAVAASLVLYELKSRPAAGPD